MAKLATPSFHGRSYVGKPMAVQVLAEVSACQAFQNHPDVQEVARKMPPPATKVKRHVTNVVLRLKRQIEERGANHKLVTKQVIQELFSQFQSMGCRAAIWDGNV